MDSNQIFNSFKNINKPNQKSVILNKKTDAFNDDSINDMYEPFIRINTNNRYNSYKSFNSYSKNGDELDVSQVSKFEFLNKSKNKDSGINLIADKVRIKMN